MAGTVRHGIVRYLAAVLGLILLVAACADPDPAEEKPSAAAEELEQSTINVGIIPINDLTQIFVALENGYFEDEGLTVQTTEMASGAVIAPAVEAGEIDLGWSNAVSMVQSYDQGFDFTFLADAGGAFNGEGGWNHVMLASAGSDIQSPEDLAGTNIAVNALGNIFSAFWPQYLGERGVDFDSVSLLEIPFPEQPAALADGRVDATVLVEPFITIALDDGAARVIDERPFATIAERPLVAGWFSTAQWLESNPNTAGAFARAITRATEDINNDPDAVRELLPNYTALSPELADQIIQPLFDAQISPGDVEPWIKASLEAGLIREAFEPSALLRYTLDR